MHVEVLRVGHGQHGPVRSRGRCDEAVRLPECDCARGIRPTPVAGPPTRIHGDREYEEAPDEMLGRAAPGPVGPPRGRWRRRALCADDSPKTCSSDRRRRRPGEDQSPMRSRRWVDPVLDAEGGRSCPMAFAAGLRRSIAGGARRYSRWKHDSLSMGGPACQLWECGDYPWLGRRSPGGCRRARRSGSLQLAPAPGAQRTPDSRMLRVRNSVFSRSWVSAGSTC